MFLFFSQIVLYYKMVVKKNEWPSMEQRIIMVFAKQLFDNQTHDSLLSLTGRAQLQTGLPIGSLFQGSKSVQCSLALMYAANNN